MLVAVFVWMEHKYRLRKSGKKGCKAESKV